MALPGFQDFLEIGRGSMGVVYRATQQCLDRPVAIKTIPAGFFDEQTRKERLKQLAFEGKLLASLSPHGNVLQVHAMAWDIWGNQALVFEFVEGDSLRNLLQETGLPTWVQSLGLARQVARGLRHVHSEGVVHRDIKPANLMVNRRGTLKIMDFGVAFRMGEMGLNPAGCSRVGTPLYMAPEVVLADPAVDHRADLYSLGVLIFQLLCGRPPFMSDSGFETAQMHLHARPPKPRSLAPDLPEEIEAFLLKALAKDPGARFQSAAEMLAEIDRLLELLGYRKSLEGPAGSVSVALTGNRTELCATLPADTSFPARDGAKTTSADPGKPPADPPDPPQSSTFRAREIAL
ncbi:MAG: serine/threonine-protein kinase [Sumerlaeia bacterium]